MRCVWTAHEALQCCEIVWDTRHPSSTSSGACCRYIKYSCIAAHTHTIFMDFWFKCEPNFVFLDVVFRQRHSWQRTRCEETSRRVVLIFRYRQKSHFHAIFGYDNEQFCFSFCRSINGLCLHISPEMNFLAEKLWYTNFEHDRTIFRRFRSAQVLLFLCFRVDRIALRINMKWATISHH